MLGFPNAKINLGLNIIEKRPDGYHNLLSVMYPVKGLFDVLEISRVDSPQQTDALFEAVLQSGKMPESLPPVYHDLDKLNLGLSGIEIPGNPAENILAKAYNLIDADYNLPPTNIHLHKVIPSGAGLGGGSADAAFAIKMLDEVLEIGLAWGEKHHYARQLGSDCSFFINNKPAFCFERGDQFENIDLDLSAYHLVLVKPPIHVSTADAYAGIKPKAATVSPEDIVKTYVSEWRLQLVNDFEETVFAKHPQIATIKDELYRLGATYACMSGSGSSVFGIFEVAPKPDGMFSDCFIWQGKL